MKQFKALVKGRAGSVAGGLGSAARCRRRRVRFLDERPRDRVPPQVQHSLGWGTAVNVRTMVFGA